MHPRYCNKHRHNFHIEAISLHVSWCITCKMPHRTYHTHDVSNNWHTFFSQCWHFFFRRVQLASVCQELSDATLVSPDISSFSSVIIALRPLKISSSWDISIAGRSNLLFFFSHFGHWYPLHTGHINPLPESLHVITRSTTVVRATHISSTTNCDSGFRFASKAGADVEAVVLCSSTDGGVSSPSLPFSSAAASMVHQPCCPNTTSLSFDCVLAFIGSASLYL